MGETERLTLPTSGAPGYGNGPSPSPAPFHERSKDKIDCGNGYDGGARIAAGSDPFGAEDDTHRAGPIVFDCRRDTE